MSKTPSFNQAVKISYRTIILIYNCLCSCEFSVDRIFHVSVLLCMAVQLPLLHASVDALLCVLSPQLFPVAFLGGLMIAYYLITCCFVASNSAHSLLTFCCSLEVCLHLSNSAAFRTLLVEIGHPQGYLSCLP